MTAPRLDSALRALKAGNVVIFPTDTVYGMGLSVNHAQSPGVLFDLKQREQHKPVAWLVGSIDDLDVYGKAVPDFARVLARTFWPGPLTLVVRASESVPAAFRSDEGTIGLRMPKNATALKLVQRLGCPIATTSANIAGCPAAHCVGDIDRSLQRGIGIILADDEVHSGIASTVLDCTEDHPMVLREGAVTISDIRAFSQGICATVDVMVRSSKARVRVVRYDGMRHEISDEPDHIRVYHDIMHRIRKTSLKEA